MAAWKVEDRVVRLPEKAGDAYTRSGHVSAVDVAEQTRSSRKGATGTITITWLRDEVKKMDINFDEVFDVADIAKKVKQVAAAATAAKPAAASKKAKAKAKGKGNDKEDHEEEDTPAAVQSHKKTKAGDDEKGGDTGSDGVDDDADGEDKVAKRWCAFRGGEDHDDDYDETDVCHLPPLSIAERLQQVVLPPQRRPSLYELQNTTKFSGSTHPELTPAHTHPELAPAHTHPELAPAHTTTEPHL